MAQKLKFGNGTWATKEGSTLAYNDENEKYKPLPFSFERDSIGTRVNKEGLIEVVGNDIPRIDYTDSTEGALLLENSSTNLVTYSEDFSQSSWIKNNCTITSDNSVSPDGTQNADKLDFTTSNGEIVRTTSFVSGQEYTMSFYAKTESGTLNFDYGNMNYVSVSGTATTEWQRFELTQTLPSATRYPKIQTTEIGSLLLWGFQIEQGNLSSYIPTNGSTVQRAAETCNGSGNSEVFNSQEGVLFLDTKALSNDGTTRTIGLSDGSNSNRIHFINYAVANGYSVNYRVSNSTQVAFTEIGNVLDYQKIAFKYKSGDFSLWYNGFEIDTDSNTNMMADGVLNTLSFRQEPNSLPFYGKTKEIGYYDEILTDLELETLTSYRSLNEMVTELNLNAL